MWLWRICGRKLSLVWEVEAWVVMVKSRGAAGRIQSVGVQKRKTQINIKRQKSQPTLLHLHLTFLISKPDANLCPHSSLDEKHVRNNS